MAVTGKRKRPAQDEAPCRYCRVFFKVRGLGRHQASCPATPEPTDGTDQDPVNAIGVDEDCIVGNEILGGIVEVLNPEDPDAEDAGRLESIPEEDGAADAQTDPNEEAHREGDIVIEYHPNSGKQSRTLSPEEYKRLDEDTSKSVEEPAPDENPWLPFASREEFEFAELVHDAKLNQKQIQKLLDIFHQGQKDPSSFKLRQYKDLKDSLEDASRLLTTFERHKIKRKFKETEFVFDTWCRPLWNWILDHLHNEDIVRHFEWDAQKIFRLSKGKLSQVFTEPWTGKRFWDIQSALPSDAKIVALELYADKSKLASFGTQKGYPVMARIANLPVKMRKRKGVGGTQIVGWLPVVDNPEEHKDLPGWVDFKQVVCHESFLKLLESIENISVTGHVVPCADDYEEQSVMSLIRGVGSHHPCPRCVIHEDHLWDFLVKADHRTTETMTAVVQEARQKHLGAGEKEEILKAVGLRDVDNMFWKMNHGDPYAALSFDRLHTFSGGLFRHLWKRVGDYVGETLIRDERTAIDNMAESVPRWRCLTHFSNYLSVEFTDGSKWEDLSKICVPVLRDVIGHDADGLLLLRCVQAFVELDILSSFEVQTESSIRAGKLAAKRFSRLANEYQEAGWNYPKMHLVQHLFEDVMAKGVTRNYMSKTFEKLHGGLGAVYQRVTNFKDVSGQILRVEHESSVLALLRSQVDRYDEYWEDRNENAIEIQSASGTFISGIEGPKYVVDAGVRYTTTLGSKQKPLTIRKLLEDNTMAPEFTAFCARVSHTIQVLSHVPGDTTVVDNLDQITKYQLLKVDYESYVDWKMKKDYLRCNPSFHGHPRYDFVITRIGGNPVFAQLVFIFVCRANKVDYRLAIVQPLEKKARTGETGVIDKSLSIHRWTLRSRSRCEVIPVDSIVRGAVLVKDPNFSRDYFVIDTLDEDMFLRVKNRLR